MHLSQFQYELPDELIATHPLAQRSASRLLCLDGVTGDIVHRQFSAILTLIQPDDLLIVNNTKVIPARLFGNKETGGRVEILIERILSKHRALAHIRASKSPKPNSAIFLADTTTLRVLGRHNDLFELECDSAFAILDIVEKLGQIPLPPYFQREPEGQDKERYQTIYAKYKGSVAAPTAGLHFDEDLWQQLAAKRVQVGYVTLHVGAGTFAPVRTENIQSHKMHPEYCVVSQKLCEQVKAAQARGGRIIAVGTTSVRSLETAARSGELKAFEGDTSIFIYPGFQFNCVDALITNLHLPGSTLLMLISAFAGYENVMKAYQDAITEKYRFFSYGDAMWLTKHK